MSLFKMCILGHETFLHCTNILAAPQPDACPGSMHLPWQRQDKSKGSGRLPISPASSCAAPLWSELPRRKTALTASPALRTWELSTSRGGQRGMWSWSPAGADQSDTGSLVAAATQPRERNHCPRFAFHFHGQNAGGMLSTHCRLGRKVHCSLCLSFLSSHYFTSWWQAGEHCARCGQLSHTTLKVACCCSARRRTLLQWKKASVTAVLLMLVAKLHVKPQHSWFSCFCALWCPGTEWILGGLWENLSAQSPSNTHISCGIEKEELLVYEGDFSCFPAAEHDWETVVKQQ